MKISAKITLALTGIGLILFSLYAYNLIRQEERDLLQAVYRETSLLTHTLQTATEHALRDQQLSDIEESIQQIEEVEPLVDVFVFDSQGQLRAMSADATEASSFARDVLADVQKEGGYVVRLDDDRSPHLLAVGVPLKSDTSRYLGAVIVTRPLTEMRKDLSVTRRDIILSVIIFVILASGFGLVMGRVYIKRPLDELMSAMQGVQSGDLQSFYSERRRDEMHEVAVEFNRMLVELQNARTELLQEVDRRHELEQGFERADKLITVGQLAASLAHEIGSPLQVIVGRARAMLDRDCDPERVRHHASIIAHQGERITQIVSQLLSLAKRRSVQMARSDLRRPVTAICDLLSHEAERNGIRLGMEAAEDLPSIRCDESQIEQVVLNLVRNALNATPPGGMVNISLTAQASTDGAGPDGPALCLEVRDSGSGIAPADRSRIFDAFYTTRPDTGGVGLGLAVVKSIVEEAGGRITVADNKPAGMIFRVYFPVPQEDTA